MARRTSLLAAVLAVGSLAGVVTARAQGSSTNDGVYTSAQASSGQELFAQACESCHQPEKFTGAEFTRAYVGRPLSELNGAMAEMPVDNPGSLTAEDVASLIAYFLQMNTYPVGETPLSGEPDALRRIMVDPRP